MNFHLKAIGLSLLLAFVYTLVKGITELSILTAAIFAKAFFIYLLIYAILFYIIIITGRFIYHHANIQTSVYLAEQKRKEAELRRYYNDM